MLRCVCTFVCAKLWIAALAGDKALRDGFVAGVKALFVLFLHIACGRTISSMEFRFSMATSRRSPRITATSPRIPRATAISRRSPRITTTNPRILTMTFRKNYLIYLVTMINWLLMVLKAQIFLKNSAQPRVLKVMNPH